MLDYYCPFVKLALCLTKKHMPKPTAKIKVTFL